MPKKTMSQYLAEDSEMRERFIGHAFRENSKISDFGDFSSALFSSFDTEKGRKASKFFNDDELILLFKDSETERQITKNISKEEYDAMIKGIGRTETEVQRELPVGKEVKPKQVVALLIPKTLKVTKHSRKGKAIKSYSRGFRKWTPAETRFLRVRKKRNVTPKQIALDYNKHFKESPRSVSSINTKVFRTS